MRIGEQIRFTGPGNLDSKKQVGTGYEYESIDEFLSKLSNTNALQNGMLVEDVDYGITWQIYSTTSDSVSVSVSTDWAARLYDGRFRVKSISNLPTSIVDDGPPTELEISGSTTYDGVTNTEGDVVMVVNADGPMNGIWIVHESEPWERHPIFDQSVDNIRAVTFVVDNGTLFKNTQWQFTTRGDIYPTDLVSDPSILYNDVDEYLSYTWLNFEMIGGGYPDNFSDITNKTTGYMGINAAAENKDVYAFTDTLMPYREYLIQKIDTSSNMVYLLTKNDGDVRAILPDTNDWAKVKLTTAEPTAQTGAIGSGGSGSLYEDDEVVVYSNRVMKKLEPTAVSAAGQLSESVASGNLTGVIVAYVSADGGVGDSYLNLGTTSGAFDIASSITIDQDGTKSYLEINDSTITDIWVSEVGGGFGFNGNTVTFEIYTVKQ